MMTKRRLMTAAAALALAGCMPSMGIGGGLPIAFLGPWEGRGSQSDMPGEWTISANIQGGQPGTVVGTIAYPSLECRGDLTLRVAAQGAMELAEHITSGDCVDGGIITLRPVDGGRLRFDWRKEGSPDTAEGTLWRPRS
jgi:hypothetical protein